MAIDFESWCECRRQDFFERAAKETGELRTFFLGKIDALDEISAFLSYARDVTDTVTNEVGNTGPVEKKDEVPFQDSPRKPEVRF